jgi:hypothetical protein
MLLTGFVANAGENPRLIAVGAGSIDSDDQATWIQVLGQRVIVDIDTTFPRGLIEAGDYVSVSGWLNHDGTARATSVVRLGGQYSAGNSPVYLLGPISQITREGRALLGGATVDLAQAYHSSALLDVMDGQLIEIIGFEFPADDMSKLIIATAASPVSGISGSGARGISGSGARGISGSGARGISGSGARGISGSGART